MFLEEPDLLVPKACRTAQPAIYCRWTQGIHRFEMRASREGRLIPNHRAELVQILIHFVFSIFGRAGSLKSARKKLSVKAPSFCFTL